MGCICSKAASSKSDDGNESQRGKVNVHVDGSTRGSSKNPSKVQSGVNSGSLTGSSRVPSRVTSSQGQGQNSGSLSKNGDDPQGKGVIVERPPSKVPQSHHKGGIEGGGGGGGGGGDQKTMSRIVSMSGAGSVQGGFSGWPSWLTSVAAEAIQGWVPRRADSFQKLDKIGQGTYSSVYKARDLETGKIVAMKKVRFVNMDPESVRFMAREIVILRKLDHPNIMKLECLVTSRMSGSLYLVFEYMEHDLTGLLGSPGNKFTEPQIKCYMKQLLSGLEHCHSRGVLHRDIKGSNLLISNDGVLKIADFGLATFFKPDQRQPLTSRVVTLWYRAPELLLGSTNYGVAVDMWSVGCILAELFAGKPIMPGRTEVEQMHKIFKLCGSPSESYWKKTKLPHATSFKPQQPYKRRLRETFKDFPTSALVLADALLSIEPDKRGTTLTALKSEFFTTDPLPCDPSSLPKYAPSKEFDVKLRDEEARRKKAESVKGRGPESVRRGQRQSKINPEFDIDSDASFQGKKGPNKYSTNEETSYKRHSTNNNHQSQSSSVVHPSAAGASWNKKARDDDSHLTSGRTRSESRSQKPGLANGASDVSNLSSRRDEWTVSKHNVTAPIKRNIQYSGPLVPHGGNVEEMLKEHERQIQQAVRKARVEKVRNKDDDDHGESRLLNSKGRNGR